MSAGNVNHWRIASWFLLMLLASLIFLVEQLGKIGKSLCRGQIVLAGSPLPLYRAEPGDRFEVSCDRLPGVRARIL